MSHRMVPNILGHFMVCRGCGLRTNNLNVISAHTNGMLDKTGRCPEWGEVA